MTIASQLASGGTQSRTTAEVAREQARANAELAREMEKATREIERENAQAAREQAQASREDAQQSVDPGPARGPVPTAIVINGQTIPLEAITPELLQSLGIHIPRERDGAQAFADIAMAAVFCTTAAFIVWLGFRYRTRVKAPPPVAVPRELTEQMARMESALESVAVEVERISEGQRFAAKLLSQREPVEVGRG
jgi:hypothetical protein